MGSYYVTSHPSLTDQSFARKLNILTNETTVLGVYSDLIPKELVGSSLIVLLKNKNLDVTQYRISLDVSVKYHQRKQRKKKIRKRSNFNSNMT